MKIVYILIFSLFATVLPMAGQDESSNALVKEGVALHDKGDYKGAISLYEKALKLNPSLVSATYEMSLSYLNMKEYNKALKHSSKVIELNFKPLLVDAYAVKGTALADLNKKDEAIALFKEAIDKCGEEYLLYFNLGLCYFNEKKYNEAIEYLGRSIEIDATHSSAFLLYAYALNDTNRWVESFYAFHFFLLLEPNVERSADAFAEMMDIVYNDYDSETIAELVAPNNMTLDDVYANMTVGKPENEEDMEAMFRYFQDISHVIFSLGSKPSDEDCNTSLFWYFFVPTYNEILNSGYFETYCRYVSVAYFEDSLEWWNNNKDSVDQFINWFENGETAESLEEQKINVVQID